MTKTARKSRAEMIELNIPFTGFYESIWSEGIDYEIKRYLEYRADSDSDSDEAECLKPEELRFSEDELNKIFWDGNYFDYDAARESVVINYVNMFGDIFKENTGVDLGIEFVTMTSPREYNFETDRVFANVKASAIRDMFAKSKVDNHVTLSNVIRERFTSRSGFVSFYSNDVDTWLAKPLLEWDQNELSTLLRAIMEMDGMCDDLSDVGYDMQIYYDSSFDTAFDKSMDYSSFCEAVDKARLERVETIQKDTLDFVMPDTP